MANSSEKYSNDFKETIKVIFNETECSEWYKGQPNVSWQ